MNKWLLAVVVTSACAVKTAPVGSGLLPAPSPSASRLAATVPSAAVPSQVPTLKPTATAIPRTDFDLLAADFSTVVPARPRLRPGQGFFSRESSLNLVFKGQQETVSPLEINALGVPVIWPSTPAVAWLSQDPAVAKVSADGVVEAVGEGTTEIVASQGLRELSLPVQVRWPDLQGHYFDQSIMMKRFSGPSEWMTPLPVQITQSGPGSQIEAYRLLALKALKTWQEAEAQVRFSVVPDPDQAYVTIDWVEDLEPFGTADNPVPAQAAAMTISQVSYLGATDKLVNRRIIHCLIKDRETGKDFSSMEMQKILTHEVGHALGITGHSPDTRDIMYASISSDNSLSLTSRDVETLKWALFATPNLLTFQILGREAAQVCRFR